MEIKVAKITETCHNITDYCLIEYNENAEPKHIFMIEPIIPRPENYAFEAGKKSFQWKETREELKNIDELKTIKAPFQDRHLGFSKLSDAQLREFRGGFRAMRYLNSKTQ